MNIDIHSHFFPIEALLKTIMQISIVLVFAMFATLTSAQQRPSYGVSGVTSEQDEQVAKAGLEALK